MAEIFTGSNPFVIPRAIINRGGVRVAALTGNETWTLKTSTVQILDGGASNRTITLPTIGANCDGAKFVVYNAGTTNNIILSDGGNVVTIAAGGWAAVYSEGTDWTLGDSSSSSSTTHTDGTAVYFGTGNDIGIAWDGTRLNVTQATPNSEIRWGVDGAGIDQMWYGDTASTFMTWDQSADSLIFADNAKAVFGTGSDIAVYWDATDLRITQAGTNSSIKVGASGAGMDLLLYGDTVGRDLLWDQSLDSLIFADNAILGLGSGAGAGADITMAWNGTKLLVGQLTANSAIDFGVDGAGIDLVLYGDTASAACTWDQSADSLILSGVAKIKLQTIAAATGTAIPVTHSGSFPVTTAAAETNTLADPSFLGQTLTIFVDTYAVGDRVITAASRINQAGNTIITLGAVGDFIKLEAITIAGALKWQVVANDGAALSGP